MKYQVIRSDRKTVELRMSRTGELTVRAPLRMRAGDIAAFVASREDWIVKTRQKMAEQPEPRALTYEQLQKLADAAFAEIPPRVKAWATVMGVTFGKITIKNPKTLWGSCTAKGDLNFDCRLMLCPADVRDYVIVHELCHRIHFNHSPEFWNEVARWIPDYKEKRKWLKTQGTLLSDRQKDGM